MSEPNHAKATSRTYVATYGGQGSRIWDATPGMGWTIADTVQHWSLHFKGQFIADTSVPEIARLFEDMVEILNQHSEVYEK